MRLKDEFLNIISSLFELTKFSIFLYEMLFCIRCWRKELVQVDLLLTGQNGLALQVLLETDMKTSFLDDRGYF